MFKQVIQGNGFYSKDKESVCYLEQCLICINDDGIIQKVVGQEASQYNELRMQYMLEGRLKILDKDQILLPGFVDLHVHASQWPQAGMALDKPLEVWLQEYTFPLESKLEDVETAYGIYSEVVQTTLNNATTSAMYFATVDPKTTLLLSKLCAEKGQRGFVGTVAMDEQDNAPSYYRDASASTSASKTVELINQITKVQGRYHQKVYPVVTPRFIPTCSREALIMLGKVAQEHDVYIQSHVSESDWEHGYVKEKTGMNDAQALDTYGLLTSKTILAHANFLEESDGELLAQKGASIAHCPLSNSYFANSVLPVRRLMEQGVNIGLATDISGGYSPSMYQAIRQAVISSKMLQDGVNPNLPSDKRGVNNSAITLNTAFYMATVAGGLALNLKLGKFEPGYIFDAQVVDICENLPRYNQEKSKEDLLHKVLLLAQRENIKEVWVQGVQVVK